jgi:dipeptide/tripeptide permease
MYLAALPGGWLADNWLGQQLLLGNMGMAGGGVNALRGHSNRLFTKKRIRQAK